MYNSVGFKVKFSQVHLEQRPVVIQQQSAIKNNPLASRLVAVVDLGSNSFHLVIAELSQQQFHIVARVREAVRLGAGLDAQNCLTLNAEQRACDCLQRFHERLTALKVTEVYALGTNTLRIAANAPAFLARAEKILGHPIRVISGIEEAELIFQGASYGRVANEHELIIDIGGGSTEIIIGYQNKPEIMQSLAMGCVSFSVEFFENKKEDIPTIFSKIQQRVTTIFQPILDHYLQIGWQSVIGCSGTIQAVASVGEANGWSKNQEITEQSLEKIMDYLSQYQEQGLSNLAGLRGDRQAIFPAGVAILKALFYLLQIKTLTLSSGALREGMLYRLLQQNTNYLPNPGGPQVNN